MAEKEATFVLSLDEGITETVVIDTAGGVVTRSENTRLTKLKGTVSRRPATGLVLAVPPTNINNVSVCGGIVPGPGQSALAMFPPATGSKRLYGTKSEPLRGTLTGTAGQNAYYPARIEHGTAVDGSPVAETPATIIDNLGYQWTLSVRQTGDGTVGLFVDVHLNGATVVSSRKLRDLSVGGIGLFALHYFVGITLATDNVVLWWEESTGIYAARATLSSSGMGVFTSTPVLICAPQTPTAAPATWHPADVTSNRLSRHFIITRSTASKTAIQIREVDGTTLAVTQTITLTGSVSDSVDPVHLAVNVWPFSDTVMYAFSHSTGSGFVRYGVINRATGATIWNGSLTGDYGPCAVQPMTDAGVLYLALASTRQADVFSGQQRLGFTHYTYAAGAKTGPLDYNLFWYQLQSRGGYFSQDQTSFAEIYAYWSVMPSWGPSTRSSRPGDLAYVIDPSVEVITYGHGVYTPIARMGADRASMRVGLRNGNSFFVHRDTGAASLVYSEKRYDVVRNALTTFLDQDGARLVQLNLRPEFTAVTAAANGAAFVAGAMPVAWDGVELVEAGPLHRMKCRVVATGGTGPDLTGKFFVVAVASYRDSAGNVHRSAPSLPFEITLAGTKPVVEVTQPYSFRNGVTQERPTISLYWTLAGGSTFYQQPPFTAASWTTTTGYVVFPYAVIPTAVNGDRLPSTGADNEPLLPECPPPAWDMQTVDGRVWVIDAENRNVALPSLLKEDAQVTYEWNGSMRIASFDPQYGKLMAIAKYGETLILAERCIWRVSGQGPNNSGQGQGFSDPEIVSYVGCRSRASVAQVPGVGVLFQADCGRMAMYTGQVTKFDTLGIYEVGAPTVHRQECEVIYPLLAGGYLVYNWVKNAWTTWPEPGRVTAICTQPVDGSTATHTYLFQADAIRSLDSNTVDDSGTLRVIRGWIAPESTQGDCVIREVWLQALHGGASHSVTLTAYFDYNESTDPAQNQTLPVSRTWTSEEVRALTRDGRYTLGLNCHAKPSRAVKVLVESVPVSDESSDGSEGMQPLSLTVLYAASPGPRRRTLLEGAVK